LLLKQEAIRRWEQVLPATTDFQQHHAEIKIDALPGGEYILLAGNSAEFSLGNTHFAATRFHVSNISYVKRDSDYFVLHRGTGEPLAKASVQIPLPQSKKPTN